MEDTLNPHLRELRGHFLSCLEDVEAVQNHYDVRL